jgi:hypothetical protein
VPKIFGKSAFVSLPFRLTKVKCCKCGEYHAPLCWGIPRPHHFGQYQVPIMLGNIRPPSCWGIPGPHHFGQYQVPIMLGNTRPPSCWGISGHHVGEYQIPIMFQLQGWSIHVNYVSCVSLANTLKNEKIKSLPSYFCGAVVFHTMKHSRTDQRLKSQVAGLHVAD